MEVHDVAAVQNAFRIETVCLDGRGVFLDAAQAMAGPEDRLLAVASSDPGGVKRAQLFRGRWSGASTGPWASR